MARYFGTDGVRGRANADLTPELALAVASAAARVLAIHSAADSAAGAGPVAVVGRDPGSPARCWRPRWWPACLGRRGRAAGRGAAHPGGGLPDPALRRRPRRGAVGQPQPDARQRHQAVRPGRAEAAGRPRGRDRGRDRGRLAHRPARPGSRSAGSPRVPTGAPATSSTCWPRRRRRWPASRWWWTAPTGRLRGGRRAVQPGRRRVLVVAGDRTARTSTTASAPPTSTPWPRSCCATGRPRHRPGRRRRPVPRRRRRRRRWWTATRSWPSAPAR